MSLEDKYLDQNNEELEENDLKLKSLHAYLHQNPVSTFENIKSIKSSEEITEWKNDEMTNDLITANITRKNTTK